jgi:hypothetical protein
MHNSCGCNSSEGKGRLQGGEKRAEDGKVWRATELLEKFIDFHWRSLREFTKELKMESRRLREIDFRQYFLALGEEVEKEKKYLLGVLEKWLLDQSISQNEFLLAIEEEEQVQPGSTQTAVARATLRQKTLFLLKHIPHHNTRSEYVAYNTELQKRFDKNPAFQNFSSDRRFHRMIEDCCYDKFGIDNDALDLSFDLDIFKSYQA